MTTLHTPKIWLSSPHLGEEEFLFVKEAFDSNWIAPVGPHIGHFEKDLATYTGMQGAVALSSGTAAIHLALIELGVQPGDEVICQSFTFVGTANPIHYLQAKPVFVDSEATTWNMSPQLLDEAIKKRIQAGGRPKAIIPVHLYGMPAQMREILEIANRYEIPVLEDAAEALGSSIHGKQCGSFGEFGILSFNGNKIITTSGGGALLGRNEHALNHVRFLATQARDDAPHYQHSQIGFNYRLSNVSAGIGRGQLQVLDERVRQRRANFDEYKAALQDLPGISFLPEPPGFHSNRWLTTILIDPVASGGVTREQCRLALQGHHIESRPLWKPMHLQPVFANAPFYGDGTSEFLFSQGLCLPSGSNLSASDRTHVIEVIRSCWANTRITKPLPLNKPVPGQDEVDSFQGSS